MKRVGRLLFVFVLVMFSVMGVFQYAGAEDGGQTPDAGEASKPVADKGRTPIYIGFGTGLNWRKAADDAAALMHFHNGYELTAAIGIRLEGLDNKVLQNLRFEVEYAKQFDVDNQIKLHVMGDKIEGAYGSINNTAYSLVTFYDFPIRKLDPFATGFVSHLAPYIGLGLGFCRSELDRMGSPSLDRYANSPTSVGGLARNGNGYNLTYDTDFVFVLTPRFGVTYEVSRHFDVYLGAKYVDGNHVLVNAYGAYTRPNVNVWDAQIGARYNF